MPISASPAEVLRTLVQEIADGDFAHLHDFYSEDAVVMHLSAFPAPRLTEGREAIRQHFSGFAAAPFRRLSWLDCRSWPRISAC